MEKEAETTQKSETALKEEVVLKFWAENKIFEKSLEKDSPKGEFVFYDGPPFATGTPHYGHILPGTMKDVIPRFKTMQGFHVDRRWGWDCHGLPIENLIEKELGLATKKDIEGYGIEKFNAAARASVLRYEDIWKRIIPRVGRWVDMENPYMSMQASYMESVWWVFKSLSDNRLVYTGTYAMHLCPRCETTLANFELNQPGAYQDITDLSLTAKFELTDEPGTFVLAWTTTPWTLPGNVALAVGKDIQYVKVEAEGEKFILAETLLEKVLAGKTFTEIGKIKGADLVGKSYKPLFDYYASQADLENKDRGWKIYAADFVTTEDGTGIVHIAPAFGSDDMELGRREKLPFVQHVAKNGRFKTEVTDFPNMLVKEKGNHQGTDIEIVKFLAHTGKLFSKEKIVHSYPHCWRCDTPLLNYGTTSWFVDVPKIKDRLVKNNQKTNWVPENLRDGRFGKWLEGAREWAITRSRFWGTPLPVWQSADGKNIAIIGSVEELKKYSKKSGNKYVVMRHGEGTHNTSKIASTGIDSTAVLTDEGRAKAKKTAEELKGKDIKVIYCSPLLRNKQTAEIVADVLGFPKDKIVYDVRIKEISAGVFDGKPFSFTEYFKELNDYNTPIEGGESPAMVKQRVADFLYEIDSKHKNENILIISHGIFFETIDAVLNGLDAEDSLKKLKELVGVYKPGMYREFEFVPLPHDENYELDLHRPYIDSVILEKDGVELQRIEDVFDVWFDSGSMPYAQKHYPFEKDGFDPEGGLLKSSRGFPADFIAEGLDQTRGWFYVLIVLGTALFDKAPFKNVLVNGLVLAEDGKKMSKKLKNYPEVDVVLDKYGADALRLFLMQSPAVRAEDVLFSEKSVGEIASKVMGRLRNVVAFYEMYQAGEEPSDKSKNVLDQWIISRLNQSIGEIGESLESYQIDAGSRPIIDFVEDLSTWYIRRSRDRFKSDDAKDKEAAISTTRFVLREFAKAVAPYIPFIAEEVYRIVSGDRESVHLESWPKAGKADSEVLENMRITRELVTAGLEVRQKANIKVRQPLQSLTVNQKLSNEYIELIKDEVNVREVVIGNEIVLDTSITDELKREGDFREFLRSVQGMRKDADLSPSDLVTLTVPESSREIISGFESELQKVAGIKEIKFGGEETKIEK